MNRKKSTSRVVNASQTGQPVIEITYSFNSGKNQLPQMVSEHYAYLYAQMYKRAYTRLKDVEAAQEMVQRAFVKALESNERSPWLPATNNDVLNNLSAYLCRCVETLFLDDRRKYTRRQTDAMAYMNPEWQVDNTAREELLVEYQMITKNMEHILPPIAVQVFHLISQGYTHQEIAVHTGLTLHRVRHFLYQARAVMKQWLEY